MNRLYRRRSVVASIVTAQTLTRLAVPLERPALVMASYDGLNACNGFLFSRIVLYALGRHYLVSGSTAGFSR